MGISPRCKLKYLDGSRGKVDIYGALQDEIIVKREEEVENDEGKLVKQEVERTFYRSGYDEYTEFVRPTAIVEGIKVSGDQDSDTPER
jgi:hypothetical protein